MSELEFAVDASDNVVLIGYPELDRPFSYYYGKSYKQFMNKMGYDYKVGNNRLGGGYVHKPGMSVREKTELDNRKNQILRELIIPKAKELIGEQ